VVSDPRSSGTYDPMRDGIVEVLNAGYPQRQALLRLWHKNQVREAFQLFLQHVRYDPKKDAFLMPDGSEVSAQG
jgi:hypothetical protein